MPTKSSGAPRTKKRRGRKSNYLILARDGSLLLVSGSTGKVSTLDPEISKRVLPLLRERQKLAKRLGEVLEEKGFALSDEDIIDIDMEP